MKHRFMYFWAVLFVAVAMLACGFLFACSNEKETEEPEEEFDPNALIGTWSNPEIVAETDFYGITEAKAAVELTVNKDGTLSLSIQNIYVEFENIPFDIASFSTTMTGTWEATDDSYAMKLDDNANVTYNDGGELEIAPVREKGEVIGVSLTFSITYTVLSVFKIPISMDGCMLYAGSLETE